MRGPQALSFQIRGVGGVSLTPEQIRRKAALHASLEQARHADEAARVLRAQAGRTRLQATPSANKGVAFLDLNTLARKTIEAQWNRFEPVHALAVQVVCLMAQQGICLAMHVAKTDAGLPSASVYLRAHGQHPLHFIRVSDHRSMHPEDSPSMVLDLRPGIARSALQALLTSVKDRFGASTMEAPLSSTQT